MDGNKLLPSKAKSDNVDVVGTFYLAPTSPASSDSTEILLPKGHFSRQLYFE